MSPWTVLEASKVIYTEELLNKSSPVTAPSVQHAQLGGQTTGAIWGMTKNRRPRKHENGHIRHDQHPERAMSQASTCGPAPPVSNSKQATVCCIMYKKTLVSANKQKPPVPGVTGSPGGVNMQKSSASELGPQSFQALAGPAQLWRARESYRRLRRSWKYSHHQPTHRSSNYTRVKPPTRRGSCLCFRPDAQHAALQGRAHSAPPAATRGLAVLFLCTSTQVGRQPQAAQATGPSSSCQRSSHDGVGYGLVVAAPGGSAAAAAPTGTVEVGGGRRVGPP